jgi:hypothetical protein
MDLARCDEVGQLQDGLIVRQQALLVLSHSQIDYLLAQGVWHRLYPNVYRMTGVPDTWLRRARGATLGRHQVVASHLTAAYLWGLVERRPVKIDVMAPFKKSARMPGVVVHRTRTWPARECKVQGIAVTSAARTLVDIAGKCSIETLKNAFDAGITKRLFTIEGVMKELQHIGTRGRSRVSLLDPILAIADKRYEKTDSPGEIDIIDVINRAGLPLPVPQLRIPLSQTDTAVPDFAYPDRKIAIEVQSWRWHGGPAKHDDDARRALALAALGWIVLPVLSKRGNERHFIQALSHLLHSRSIA